MEGQISASRWRELVQPGDRIFVGSGAACPQGLLRSLFESGHVLQDVEIVHIMTLGPVPWCDPRWADVARVNSFFLGPGVREAVLEGRADYTPCFLSEIPHLFEEEVIPIDVALVSVSPPDRAGTCSFGVSVDVVSAACRCADRVVAQINPRMPRTRGGEGIAVGKLAHALELAEELPELQTEPAGDVTDRIGQYVAQLIEDGSTLQLGIGTLPHSILKSLSGHRALGLHTEMMSDGVMECMKAGVIDNSRKTSHRGKGVVSFCMGGRALYDFVHENDDLEFLPSEYVNNPINIALNERMVAVNSALEVDLTGQVAADSVGWRFYSGIGGQVDFVRGAAMSRGGRPIIALPATAVGGEVSRIVGRLSDGAGVVTSRGDVHYVVTEYGVATLRGRSIRERALELIQVAHPKFREGLLEQAHRHGLVPAYGKVAPTTPDEIGGVQSSVFTVAGKRFSLRPLHPSDERRLQEFFYSHTPETIVQRYGHPVKRMGRQRAYELVSVDQRKDLALAIFEPQGPRQVIHAVGRYFLDAGGETAELAFVVGEDVRRHGFASRLLDAMVGVARRRGLKGLWAVVLADNQPMLSLFRKAGASIKRSGEPNMMRVDLGLVRGRGKARR